MIKFLWQLLLLLLFLFNKSFSQDSLSSEALTKVTTYFEIINNTITEDGLHFFLNEIQDNQFILLGEYHNSRQISEFTNLLLPVFAANGGHFLGLEVGPNSAMLLKELSSKPENTIDNLRALNTKHLYQYANRVQTPIPFFSHVSDAQFLETASKNNLELIGLDQEFKYGLLPLLDKSYANLSVKKREELDHDFKRARDTINAYYLKEFDYYEKRTTENKRFAILMKESEFINDFLARISSTHPFNKKIVNDIRKSIDIYWSANMKNYWDSNKLRTDNFITNLSNGLKDHNFDFEQDKMMFKIGGLHAAKGLNNYSMYDLGNTVYELARIHNNESLHIVFLERYSLNSNGERFDVLENDANWYAKAFKAFLQMGKKSEWTIIDLRPLRNEFYYKRKILVNDHIKAYFDRYDVVIIPPSGHAPLLNADE